MDESADFGEGESEDLDFGGGSTDPLGDELLVHLVW